MVERLDSLIGSCVGISVFRDASQWRAECHVVSDHRVLSVVLAVVRDCAEFEKRLLTNVVPVLACLDGTNQLKTVSAEGDSMVGKAIGAAVSPANPFVAGMVTGATVFQELQRQFKTEFAVLNLLSVLEYMRLRLMPVSQERFLDRLPHFRQVTKCISVVFVHVILDVAGRGGVCGHVTLSYWFLISGLVCVSSMNDQEWTTC